jgi:hypothetical protein
MLLQQFFCGGSSPRCTIEFTYISVEDVDDYDVYLPNSMQQMPELTLKGHKSRVKKHSVVSQLGFMGNKTCLVV